jgi:hypothetical protein
MVEHVGYWWDAQKGHAHEKVFTALKFFEMNQGYRTQLNLRNLRLYGNINVLGLSASTYALNLYNVASTDRMALNLVKSCIDTVCQKIGKNKIKPMFLTKGGDWSAQQKAKKLTKFIEGQFVATDYYACWQKVFLDAGIFGTGIMHIYRDGGEIKLERVFPEEIKLDDVEAMYGEPKSMHRVKSVDRVTLKAMFPSFASIIDKAGKSDFSGPANRSMADNVTVCESWHLPSVKGAKDGRHTITIESGTIVDEKYEKDHFPFVFYKFSERPLGFFGQGLAEDLTGLQVETNKLLRVAQLSFHLNGVPRVFLETSSHVNKSHINNEIGAIAYYTGTPPIFATPNPVNQQLLNWIENLVDKAYQISGISQLSAQSQKPTGLNSGKALRTFNDIESERFILLGQQAERFALKAAEYMIEIIKEIVEDDGNYTLDIPGRKFIETIDWNDIDVKDDEYTMQSFPTNFLSSTPAGKLADVQELVQAGFIDQEHGMRLLDFPDLEEYMGRRTSYIDDVESQIESMIDKGEYQSPEPFQKLDICMPVMQSAYIKARIDGVPEEKLELMRRWMEEAQRMLMMSQAATAMPPGAAPIARPEVAPSSELIPFGQ